MKVFKSNAETSHHLASVVSRGKLVLKLLGGTKRRAGKEKNKKDLHLNVSISVWWCLCVQQKSGC